MALFTDGEISELGDLQALDSSILETAKTEGVDLTRKLLVAEEALALDLAAFLLRTQNVAGTVNHNAYDLSRVVVTREVRRWHSLRTLAEVYGDAYNSHLNDRYLGRWKHFTGLSRETAELIYEVGIGLVDSPVPRSGAPAVSGSSSGGALGTYLVQTSWISATGEAGAASPVVAFTAAEGELPLVDNGAGPNGVAAFDVYVGFNGGPVTKQTGTPVPIGTSWTMPVSGLVTGPEPGTGQAPSYYVRRSRVR
jgi:hypothetical protein